MEAKNCFKSDNRHDRQKGFLRFQAFEEVLVFGEDGNWHVDFYETWDPSTGMHSCMNHENIRDSNIKKAKGNMHLLKRASHYSWGEGKIINN